MTHRRCRNFFARKFQRIVKAELKRRAEEQSGVAVEVIEKPWWQRSLSLFRLPWKTRLRSYNDAVAQEPGKGRGRYQLRPEMIRRVEGAPKLVDPSGWISEGISEQPSKTATPTAVQVPMSQMGEKEVDRGGESSTSSRGNTESTEVDKKHDPEQSAGEEMYVVLQTSADINAEKLLGSFSKSGTRTSRAVASALCNHAADQCVTNLMIVIQAADPRKAAGAIPILRTQTSNRQGRSLPLPRTQTVEFAAIPQPITLERRISPILQEEDITYGTSHRRRESFSIRQPRIPL